MEQINLFMEKVQADEGLAAKLKEMQANNTTVEDFIALAAEHGFTVTKEDVEQPTCKGSGELSEEELSDAVGGSRSSSTCYYRSDGNGPKPQGGYACTNHIKCHFYKDKCFCYGTPNCVCGSHFSGDSPCI